MISDEAGAQLVAIIGQCRAQLGLCHCGCKRVGAVIGEIAQIADAGAVFTGQNHQRIGNVLPCILEIGRVVDTVEQVGECQIERDIRHRIAKRAGA